MPLINYISNPSFSTMCLSTHYHEPLLTAPSQLSGPRPGRIPPSYLASPPLSHSSCLSSSSV